MNIWNGTFDIIINNLLELFFLYHVVGCQLVPVEQLNGNLVILFSILFYFLSAI